MSLTLLEALKANDPFGVGFYPRALVLIRLARIAHQAIGVAWQASGPALFSQRDGWRRGQIGDGPQSGWGERLNHGLKASIGGR